MGSTSAQVEMDLIHCIECRDTRNVQRLLQSHRDPGYCCQRHHDVTPLQAAIVNNSISSVQLLLRSGASYQVTDSTGLTPFHFSCKLGYLEIARAIYSSTDPEVLVAADENGCTPLMSAAMYGHVDTVQWLLGTNTYDINAVNILRRTALHLAAEKGYIDMVGLLIKSHASVDRRDIDDSGNTNNTALHLAVKAGHASTAELLINSGADVQKRNHAGDTPLSLAAIYGHSNIVALLMKDDAWNFRYTVRNLSSGYSLEQSSDDPLSLAAIHNHVNVIRVLLRHAMPLAAIENAVLHALRGNSAESLCTLVSHVPDGFLRYDDTFLTSAFQTVIRHRATSCLRIMFEVSRVDMNRKLFNGSYLLHMAAARDDAVGVLVMLHRGADVTVQDTHSGGVLFTAFESRSCRVIRLFLRLNEIASNTHQHLPLLDQLSDLLSMCEFEGDTLQFLSNGAVQNFGLEKVRSIMQKLDFHAQNSDGNSLLHMASCLDDHRILQSLIAIGLSTDVRNVRGATPLMYHIFGAFTNGADYIRRIRLLVKAGCNVNATDGSGKNMVLHSAVIYSRVDLMWELLDAGASAKVWSNDMCEPSYHRILQRAGINPHAILLMILSGADLSELRRYLHSKYGATNNVTNANDVSHIVNNADFQMKFKPFAENAHLIFEPLSLFNVARVNIRLLFGRGVLEKSRHLPIPKILQNAVGLLDCYTPVDML